jgi:hypothetical protein
MLTILSTIFAVSGVALAGRGGDSVLIIGDDAWEPAISEFFGGNVTSSDFVWKPDYPAFEGKSGFEYVNDNSFPSLGVSGASLAVTFLPPCTIDQPHIHPTSAELMFVKKGKILGGLIDPTKDKSITFEVA